MEQNKLKAVAYMSWYTDMLPNNVKLTNEADAEPIRRLFDKQFENVEIEKFYIDVKADCYLPQFAALLEACEQNKYDLVLIPSIASLSPYLTDFISRVEQIKRASPFTELYFLLEDISTKTEDWEMAISLIYTIREEHSRHTKRKRELLKHMREIEPVQKGELHK